MKIMLYLIHTPGETYFVSKRVLFQVVWLDELHPTLAADVRSDVFVFHHVVLKLARVLESLLALCTPAGTTGEQLNLNRRRLETEILKQFFQKFW